MNASRRRRVFETIHQTLASYPDAWTVWCDPTGDWLPLLERVGDPSFELVKLAAQTAGQFGSPQQRSELQARLDAGESFVLWAPNAQTGG